MSANDKRQLKVKTGSVKRIRKELEYYEKEAVQEQERVDRLRANNVEPHDLRQAENVLAESKAMVPDSKQRLDAAVADLKKLIANLGDGIEECEELTAAKELLSEVEPLVQA